MDPFIDNLSQLEIKIHRIEANLKTQRSLFLTFTAANGNVTVTTNSSNLDLNGKKSKIIEKPSLLQTRSSRLVNEQLKSNPQMESSRKRSNPLAHSGFINGNKRRRCSSITTPTSKIKSASSSTLSPLSVSSSLSKFVIPYSGNENIGYSPSSLPHNYLSAAFDTTFSFQPYWGQSPSVSANIDMSTDALYSGQPQQAHPLIHHVHPQRPLFLPQQLTPAATPDYTDDSISDQFNLTASASPASFHYPNTRTNTHHHHHYSLSSSTCPSQTLSTLSVTVSPSANSSLADSLSHISTSPSLCPPIPQQISTCRMVDIYSNLTMDDLISFDFQNTGIPLIDNTAWYY